MSFANHGLRFAPPVATFRGPDGAEGVVDAICRHGGGSVCFTNPESRRRGDRVPLPYGRGSVRIANPESRRRATGLVRTLVVSAATLAILLVCFSIYQYSQLDVNVAGNIRTQRLPSASADGVAFADPPMDQAQPGIPLQQGVVGPGQDIRITLYPKEGTRAVMELAVKDWTPIEGAENQFLLREPDIRTRTGDGHAVRVTARRGLMDAQRKQGGGLEPRRGKLSGGVTVDYDRLTETQRASLPVDQRDAVAAEDVVRLTMEEIEFDLEYSRAFIPGEVNLTAADAELIARDVELRMSDGDNRVERLRIGGGGRLELRERGERFGLSLPASDRAEGSRLSVAEWLRSSIQKKAAASAAAPPTDSPLKRPVVTMGEDGIPVFRLGKGGVAPAKPPAHYFARVEGGVRAQQFLDGAPQARLEADVLELVRSFLTDEKPTEDAPATGETQPATSGDVPGRAHERLVLEWRDRVNVEVCADGDERCGGEARSRLRATGAPVRLAHPEGEATCREVIYQPDSSTVALVGTAEDPVMVRTTEQGVISGVSLLTQRRGDQLSLRVEGPGRLVGGGTITNSAAVNEAKEEDDLVVDFAERLDAEGRMVMSSSIDFTGTITTREQRLLDRAVFQGQVRVRQGESDLSADTVTAGFAARRGWRGFTQTMERISAEGHVVMLRNGDRTSCGRIDVRLAPDDSGRSTPQEAIATGGVIAEQGERTIRARDKLVAHFGPIAIGAPASPPAAEAASTEGGAGEIRHRDPRPKTGLTRIEAFGEVTVLDPTEELELSADELDAVVVNGREIERAVATSLNDRPATVRLDTLTVTGKEVRLHVADQWAEVPGAGRLTLLSQRDLDGRRATEPIPIAITWSRTMSYRGRENRAVFQGTVHATSRNNSTFDCDQLLVEFDERPPAEGEKERVAKSLSLWKLLERTTPLWDRSRSGGIERRFRKEPAYLSATGHAVALTSEYDPLSNVLVSRARIAGPQLSVNLRPEVSKMMIEGPGSLLLEDLRPADPKKSTTDGPGGGLFRVDEKSGPSNTLIEWDELMWYDFSIDQTRFEGNVSLKHFSGAALARIHGGGTAESADASAGRATFLSSHVLTVDFDDEETRSRGSERRMGALNAAKLTQFQATGSVSLQDPHEGLFVNADRIVYWKNREVLAIYGNSRKRANIVTQKEGQLPNQISVERLFYNLNTGQLELGKPWVKAP